MYRQDILRPSSTDLRVILDLWFSATRAKSDDCLVDERERDHLTRAADRQNLQAAGKQGKSAKLLPDDLIVSIG